MATFIFDFDGTLADTFPLVADISYDISGGPRMTAAQIKVVGQLPMLQAVQALGIPRWRLPQLILLTRPRMTARIAQEALPYPGVLAVVRQLHDAGHQLFVLSSNYERNVRAFLEAHTISDCFEGVYHCNVFNKKLGMKRVVRQNHIDIGTCYCVGNEPGDIHAATYAGIHGIAVTWSGQSVEALRAARPFRLIAKPAELLEVLK